MAVERVEVHLVHMPSPLEAHEHLTAGQPRRQVLGAVGGDECELGQGYPGERLEHGDAVGVSPVKVFEHDERRPIADPSDHLVDCDRAPVAG